jgi:TonB family protein
VIINLLVGASLKGTLVLLVACGAAWAARRTSADFRHRIWLGALVAVAALLVPVPMIEPSRLSVLTVGMAQAASTYRPGSISWTRLALWLWAAGAAGVGVRAGVSLVRLARITRAARVPAGFSGVLASPQVSTPLTWGAIRPVILLPDYALEWSGEKRDWAIRHERAHIARRDWMWQIFAQAMTCVFWFHPLVWLAALKLRNEAEHAADDAVLTAGADAAGYASQLVEVARLLRSQSALAGVSMVRTPVLEHRVTSILNAALRRRPAGWAARFGIAGAALALLLPLAAYQNEPAHRVGEPGLSAPTVASMIQPEYTQEAKDAKIQGTVALGLEVDAEGKPQNIYIVRSLDKGLDENAIAAIRQWTFNPGKKDGQPVTVAATIEVNYRLQ